MKNRFPIALTLLGVVVIVILGFVSIAESWSSPAVAAAVCNVPGDRPTIQAAVNDLSCDSIQVDSGIYHENVIVHRSLAIEGAGMDSTFVNGGGSGSVITIQSGLVVTLSHIAMTHGSGAFGGGINIDGSTLHLSHSAVISNMANQDGGGVYSSGGALNIYHSQFTDNKAFRYGGAVTKENGDLTVSNTEFLTNTTEVVGGGIYNTGVAAITNSTFQRNRAWNFMSTIGSGGGLANLGVAVIDASLFVGNSAFFSGGGILSSGPTTINNTAIHRNSSSAGTGLGGGIANGSHMMLTASTVSNNVAIDGGGIFNSGSLTVTNSTISLNGGNGGGGLQNRGQATIRFSTISSNTAIAGGGILASSGSNVTLHNTITADNPSGDDCYISFGTITSLNHNLDSDGSCNLIQANDLPNMAPMLGPLQDNGGPTETQALLPGSPAIDSANNMTCPPVDQRGVPRPQESSCDRGAYERIQTWWIFLTTILKP